MFSKNILISDFILTDNQPVYQNQSWSGQTISRSTGIQYYSLNFKVQTTKQFRQELQAFQAQYSLGRPFEHSLGWYSQYNGQQQVLVQSLQNSNAGAYIIKVLPSTKLEVGTLIQFSNHKKIYKIINNDGQGNLSIYPSLRKAVQLSENIKFNNIMGSFILQISNDKIDYNSENIISMNISAIEDVTA
ncbi:hypothetical protein ACXKU5_002853 [Yersinia enterocolitica]|uniref:Uncharacterized protein n=2 Tax=Yersinia TaxID=629 RepID=A0A0T9TPC6_YERAE|nr:MULTISPECIES: hypothetical protein [Yersinia]AKF37323.1 hypothetical protein FORC2_1176 [Yersinia enterocolitica]ALG46083.1 hypothetical protein LI89_15575 [Yersinia enterocolitica]EKN4193820.1 hypothetical protein [Yersinia enterocolitica]EKN5152673.1 hypothetical protein [Yersinia enterocolitica]EKN6127974.1 hypothetical protein [Yersinia enterocolitica]